MPAARYFSPVDTLEQKLQIERKLGTVKACKYFNLLTRFLSVKISKHEFDRQCRATIGRENIHLHNHFIRSILKKASLSKRGNIIGSSLNVKIPNGCNDLQFLCKDFLQSPRKVRTPSLRDRRFKDRPSPLGPNGKNVNIGFEDSVREIHEQQSNKELDSAASRIPLCVEDGEEVDQDSEKVNIYMRSPIQPPLAIPTYNKGTRTLLHNGLPSGTDTCQSIGELPDTPSLTKRLEQKLEMEGFKISADAAALMNKALDTYLKRLIKPCLDLAASKAVNRSNGPIQPGLNEQIGSVSVSDFRTATELNPNILGKDWSLHLEKVTGSILY
ncbi:uncharacterized protein LOC130710249 [Lotus japonicus]|uniref:uncharacterized protein LOC130710249 n=1 Tax=Lotus japonicus TaxID=34305 RepID=UPI002582ACB8|nr:uncharacterized protein LOC130710249 [Lotus japonicus]